MTPNPVNDAAKLPAGFGRLWTAQTVSSLGDGVTQAALPLLALTLTRDPMALAFITAAGTLPWLLFGVLGGADRWDRRRTMWVTDAARAVLLAIPAAAAALDVLSIALLAAVAFLLALGGLFFDTAATVYLPDLLGRDPAQLERVNTRLRGAQTAASGFAGPPAGSALLALGRPVPLLTDAVSFALSALLVRSLPAVPRPAASARESLLRQARAGASYVFRDRVLLGLALRLAAARIERQALIGRVPVTMIISQHVLYRLVRSPAVMAEQCAHLASIAERPDIALHVLPDGVNMGVWGGFALATQGNSATVSLTAIEDIPSTEATLIAKVTLAFERILGAALARGESLALIRTAKEETWKTQIT
jgi:MFS family permease